MKLNLVLATLALPLAGAGCATVPCAVESPVPGFERVSVRFMTPPAAAQFAARFDTGTNARLVGHESTRVVQDGHILHDVNQPTSFHAVLWGGKYTGEDVTYDSTPLAPGQYMFGMYDENNGTAYQGWINVNNGGDDYLDLLREWRDTVHAQKVWLGYDTKLSGKFASTDPAHFSWFSKQVRNIKRLENRINNAIEAEKWNRVRMAEKFGKLFEHTDVLLTPSAFDFSHPSTMPAFVVEELDRVRDGYPMTKIITVADYEMSVDRLKHVNDLRNDLEGNRAVFEEEIKRLQRRKNYYTVTDHLYKHDKAFVENERRLQDAVAMINRIDRQLDEHRERTYALAFLAGMFAPDVAREIFDDEEQKLQRDRVVLQERKRQIDLRFDRLPEDSTRRIDVERDRQVIASAIDNVDKRINETSNARVALNTLHDSCAVIHRQGTARVLTASIVDGSLPAYVVDALERDALMTIRLQSGVQSSGSKGTGVATVSDPNCDDNPWQH